MAAVRKLLAFGGAVATLGAGLLLWGVREQVAWSDCQVHCLGRNPWPMTALGILLLVGGGFFMAWTAAAEHAGRVLHPSGHHPDELDRPGRPARPGAPGQEAGGARQVSDRRLASVDIGSNTVHALVADIRDGRLEEVARFETMPELGAEVDRTGRIGPAKTAAALAALESVLAPARDLGYERVVAGATAAVRRAADRDEFLQRTSDAIGVPVRLLSERREAELSFLGVASVHAVSHGWLMGDMGGGSTELVVAEGRRALRWTSLPVGSGGLAARFLSDPPRPGERAALRTAATDVVRTAPAFEAEKLVMTGGTASHMPAVLSRSEPPQVLTIEALQTAVDRLDAGRAAALAAQYDLEEARIRALRGGAELLLLLLDFYGLDRFHVSHSGLRQGMILAYAERGEDWWQ